MKLTQRSLPMAVQRSSPAYPAGRPKTDRKLQPTRLVTSTRQRELMYGKAHTTGSAESCIESRMAAPRREPWPCRRHVPLLKLITDGYKLVFIAEDRSERRGTQVGSVTSLLSSLGLPSTRIRQSEATLASCRCGTETYRQMPRHLRQKLQPIALIGKHEPLQTA